MRPSTLQFQQRHPDTAIETDAAANVDSAEAAEASAETAFEDVSPTGEAADTAAGLDEISARGSGTDHR